ncbi:MAG: hypothetical protein KJ949_00895 [Nanoarchaeota archaeon]|nr:hypothetical protein [Nanoarchaeota archaeon]
MKYNLLISNHVVGSYRQRVREDKLRDQRSDEEIKIMVEQAFLHCQHPKHFRKNMHLAVYFRDLFSGQVFHPFYHLVVFPEEDEFFGRSLKEKTLVAITIKYPLEVLLNKKINYSMKRSWFN